MSAGRLDFDPTVDYYAVLDVPYTATRDEVTRAYRRLMRACHPDHARDEDERRVAEERAKLLNAAYAVLSRPERRREYDQFRRQRALADLLFQRYTGNVPGRPMGPVARVPRARAARAAGADVQAFFQLLLVTVVFVAVLVLALVTSSAALQALLLLFS